jgi:thioredoxin-like negative regulator of GroEL
MCELTNDQKQKAERLGLEAIQADDDGYLEKAALLYQQALQIDNKDSVVLWRLGELYIKQGKYLEAEKILK